MIVLGVCLEPPLVVATWAVAADFWHVYAPPFIVPCKRQQRVDRQLCTWDTQRSRSRWEEAQGANF